MSDRENSKVLFYVIQAREAELLERERLKEVRRIEKEQRKEQMEAEKESKKLHMVRVSKHSITLNGAKVRVSKHSITLHGAKFCSSF